MMISVHRESLLSALGLVSKVAVPRSPQPVLQGVKFVVTEDRVTLMSTDLEIAVQVSVNLSTIDGSEEFIVFPDKFSAALREIPDEQIKLFTDAADLVLKYSSGTFRFRRMGAEDFPKLPEFPAEGSHLFKAKVLADMLGRTVFCAGREKGRYAINGVYAVLNDGLLEMAATDGKRLAACSINLEGAKDLPGIIIPVKLAEILHKELNALEPDADVSFYTDTRQASFKFANTILSGRLVEGEYPAYKSVIPKTNDKISVIDREALLQACKTTLIFTDVTTKTVAFNFEPDSLTLVAYLPEIGETKRTVEVKYAGEPCTMGFNPQYLVDYLKVIESESVNFQFSSANRAVLITEDEDVYGMHYVLMPMQLPGRA
ncbi:MAG: DNA polymerase III subunit beta [Planctomycetota bacterium]